MEKEHPRDCFRIHVLCIGWQRWSGRPFAFRQRATGDYSAGARAWNGERQEISLVDEVTLCSSISQSVKRASIE
jgi:hypothetical protein